MCMSLPAAVPQPLCLANLEEEEEEEEDNDKNGGVGVGGIVTSSPNKSPSSSTHIITALGSTHTNVPAGDDLTLFFPFIAENASAALPLIHTSSFTDFSSFSSPSFFIFLFSFSSLFPFSSFSFHSFCASFSTFNIFFSSSFPSSPSPFSSLTFLPFLTVFTPLALAPFTLLVALSIAEIVEVLWTVDSENIDIALSSNAPLYLHPSSFFSSLSSLSLSLIYPLTLKSVHNAPSPPPPYRLFVNPFSSFTCSFSSFSSFSFLTRSDSRSLDFSSFSFILLGS